MSYKSRLAALEAERHSGKQPPKSDWQSPNDKPEPDQKTADKLGLKVVCMADIESQEVEWFWKGRIARGKTHLFCGNPGLGKSFTTIDIAARVTRGLEWPDRSSAAPIGEVVFLIGEDGLADTIRPRLDAHGADCSKVFIINSRIFPSADPEKTSDQQIRLDRDVEEIDRFLTSRPNVLILFIDPISEYLGSADSHKNAEVRAILAPLSRLAEKHGIAIVNISHLNKSSAGPAIYRTMGSLAFTAQSRVAWAFVADRDDPDRVIFVPIKNNLHERVPAMAFRIIDGRVEWEPEQFNMTADEAMAPPSDRNADKLKSACDWLRDRLADGEVESDTLETDAIAAGISKSTYWRARKDVGVSGRKERITGRWIAFLPNNIDERDGGDERDDGDKALKSSISSMSLNDDNGKFERAADPWPGD